MKRTSRTKWISVLMCCSVITSNSYTYPIFMAGWETGSNSELYANSGTYEINSSTKRTGGYSWRANPTTTATAYGTISLYSNDGKLAQAGNWATLYVRMYFLVSTLPSSGSEYFFKVFNMVAANKCFLGINPSGNIEFYDKDGSLVQTGSNALSLNTWYRIEIMVPTGSSASYEVKLNGTTELSGTANVTTSNTQFCRIGKPDNKSGNSVDFFFDDILTDNAAYPGPGQITRMATDSDGTYTAWTRGGTDSGADWSQVDEAPPTSADYLVSTLSVGDCSTVGFASTASSGISGTINSAKGHAYCIRDGSINGLMKVRMRSGTTDEDSPSSGTSTLGWLTYHIMRSTDIATGSAWTTSALDSVEFGVVESSTTQKTRCTAIYWMVDYTPAQAGGAAPNPYRRVITTE